MIEMLGVIAVLGIIATIVTINWKAILPRTQLHSAVRELAAALQGARSDAIARNAEFQVQYDIDNGAYRVITPFRVGGGLAMRDDDRQAQPWKQLPSSIRFENIQVEGTDYRKGMLFAHFDSLGTASGHTITLIQAPEDNRYTIEVQGLLGLIDYHEGLFARVPPKEDDFK
jgi:Tfp pilus assembly protein FimT